jgi:hypothetical protein
MELVTSAESRKRSDGLGASYSSLSGPPGVLFYLFLSASKFKVFLFLRQGLHYVHMSLL